MAWNRNRVIDFRFDNLQFFFLCISFFFYFSAFGGEPPSVSERAQSIIATHENEVRPIEKEGNLAWWNANLSGKASDFAIKEKIQNQLDEALGNSKRFSEIKKLYESKLLKEQNPSLARQIEILFLTYQPSQVNAGLLKQMNAKSNEIEKEFNVYRAKIDGKDYTSNQIAEILKKSTNSNERQQAWEASKKIGSVVEKDLIKLIKLRNKSARALGYSNYHSMSLALNEQNPEQILKLFDDLDILTRDQFLETKNEIDQKLAEKYKITPSELMPWHYEDLFFQEVPAVFNYNPDLVYSKLDLVKLVSAFYKSIGLPIDEVLSKSSLYEQSGKTPHAFTTDIDREGDVRVIMNIQPTQYWMSTSLHEFGHSVYSSKYIPASVPYLLRAESHILTTEGLAMMFQRLARKPGWLKGMGVKVSQPEKMKQAEKKMLRAELLIFSRWTQVMLRFEKAMYENPDQNLGDLWWTLVEKYQNLKRPPGRTSPDYASKIHIVTAPCYYHNYEMGELFASQVHNTLAKEILHENPSDANYVGKLEVGRFLIQKIFTPAKSLNWNELTFFATGAELNSKAFTAELRND